MQDEDIIDMVDYNISTGKVMRMLGCSRQTVCNLIEDGKLDAIKLSAKTNAKWRISRKSLLDFIERSLTGSVGEGAGEVWAKR